MNCDDLVVRVSVYPPARHIAFVMHAEAEGHGLVALVQRGSGIVALAQRSVGSALRRVEAGVAPHLLIRRVKVAQVGQRLDLRAHVEALPETRLSQQKGQPHEETARGKGGGGGVGRVAQG